MATPAATAAPPAPQTVPESAPAAQPSTLAQLFTPVQPARQAGADRAQPLGSTSALRQDAEGADGGGSSSRGGRDAVKEGPVAALVRALAGRLGRTGTTTSIKRTHDVKETRVSGSSSNSTSASKNDRSAQHRSNRDAKLADLNNKQQHSRAQQDLKKTNTRDAKSTDAKAAKADTSAKNHRDQRDTRDAKLSDAKTAKADNASKRDDKNHRDTKTAKGSDTKGSDTKTAPAKPGNNDTAARVADKPNPPNTDGTKAGPQDKPTSPAPLTKNQPRTQPAREAGYRDGTRAAAAAGHVKAWRDGTRDGWDDRTAADQAEKRQMDDAKARNATRPQPSGAPKMTPAGGSTVDLEKKPVAVPAKPTTPPTMGPRRLTPVTAAVVGAAERQTMTAAKPAGDATSKAPGNAPAPEQAKTTQPIPAAPPASAETLTPYRPAIPPQPYSDERPPVAPARDIAVGRSSVTFTTGPDEGQTRTMSRGEVRTLQQFERRMEGKQAVLAQIAEDSKTASAHAAEHARRAQTLAEDSKAVHGGVALVTRLHRLAEQAASLRQAAETAEWNAVRGAEAVKVLAANAETRHGGIYKAVVDSPLTTPAERSFYRDQQGG